MEYSEGPPVTLSFQGIEHMWLRLPTNDLVWQLDDTDRGQYRADQLLRCADRLFTQASEQQQAMTSRYAEHTLTNRRINLAREVMQCVAPWVSCDVYEVIYYVQDQASGAGE